MKMKEEFRKFLLETARNGTGCSIQYAKCPCNTCFHDWAENDLGLEPKLSHALWLIALSLRGDYTKRDIQEGIEELV